MRSYQEEVRDILANVERYHRAYYEAETFRGPSLYFHHRALETRQSPGDLAYLEYVYAALASWGMHRMGKGGSKILVSLYISRVQPQSFSKMSHRFLDFALASQSHSQIVVDERVVGGNI
jgi:hypothetical protein